MKRSFTLVTLMCLIGLSVVLCGGCDEEQKVVLTPEGTFTPSYLKGQETAGKYAEGKLLDYAVVWILQDVRTELRGEFLDGFEAGLAKQRGGDSAKVCRKVLEESVTGNQFETAKDLGAKHAAKVLTNEQIQGTIHSSLGVSQGVALGWKAGYVKGYAAQRVADTAAAASVSQTGIKDLRAEALATYHALRAAIGS